MTDRDRTVIITVRIRIRVLFMMRLARQNHWTATRIAHVSVAMIVLLLAGCGPRRTPYPASLNSERPEERIAAMKQAAQLNDYSVIGLLIDRLEDEDPAARMFAILALERMTGTRLGYDYGADETQRWRAVQVWRRFWVQRPEGETPRQFAQRLADGIPPAATEPMSVGEERLSHE